MFAVLCVECVYVCVCVLMNSSIRTQNEITQNPNFLTETNLFFDHFYPLSIVQPFSPAVFFESSNVPIVPTQFPSWCGAQESLDFAIDMRSPVLEIDLDSSFKSQKRNEKRTETLKMWKFWANTIVLSY